jgi:hypothetical protein
MIKLTNILSRILNENKEFGNYLFGGEDTGVKIGWYDKIKEPDLEKEKELFDLIYWFINVGAEDPGD